MDREDECLEGRLGRAARRRDRQAPRRTLREIGSGTSQSALVQTEQGPVHSSEAPCGDMFEEEVGEELDVALTPRPHPFHPLRKCRRFLRVFEEFEESFRRHLQRIVRHGAG